MREETHCHHYMGYSLAARILLHAPSNRQDSTYHGLCYTSGGALAGTIYEERLHTNQLFFFHTQHEFDEEFLRLLLSVLECLLYCQDQLVTQTLRHRPGNRGNNSISNVKHFIVLATGVTTQLVMLKHCIILAEVDR